MCGRFPSSLQSEDIARLFRTTGAIRNLGPSWNLARSQEAMVIVPSFTKDLKAAPNRSTPGPRVWRRCSTGLMTRRHRNRMMSQ